MMNSLNILIKIFYGYILVAVFLLLSCDHKDQADGNVPVEDSSFIESVNGHNIKTYNERLAEQTYLHYCVVWPGRLIRVSRQWQP